MRRTALLTGLVLTASLALVYSVVMAQEGGYIGSQACARCHGSKYESYQQTWHARILRSATDETIVADFDSTDPDLTFSEDEVAYVVGGQFSQRYLTEIEGVLFILPAQWNVETSEWVAYHADDWQERPYLQYCAGCHTTGLDVESGLWSEEGVQCEACHGPGLDHVALAGDPAAIVNPALLGFEERAEVCGQCHLRGHDPSGIFDFPVGYQPGGPLSLEEAFIRTTEADAFWPDGSSRTHHQEYQDWKLSGHVDSVTCTFCHVSHSRGETKHQTRFVGNHRCVICHEEKKDLALHIPYHPVDNLVCTDCHMPTLVEPESTDYNFDIHSHTFWPPNPLVTIQYGGQQAMPNACNVCHNDRSPEWAAEAMGLEIEEVTLAPTQTAMPPPTVVPTITPFLGLEEGDASIEAQSATGNLLLWSVAGLGMLIGVVILILAVQGRGNRGRGEA